MVVTSLFASPQMATAASKHSKHQLPSNFASFLKNAGKVNPAAGGIRQLSIRNESARTGNASSPKYAVNECFN
jgi:hypothetical protein